MSETMSALHKTEKNASLTPSPIRNAAEDIMAQSVLARWWIPICIIQWAFFIIFQIGMGVDRYMNPDPLCPYTDSFYGDWYWYTVYAVLGGFSFIWSILVLKLFVATENGDKAIPMYMAFNIVTMATIATYIAVVFKTGVCIDVLGGAYPAAIWGEWLACGPMLFFTTVTVVDKPHLSLMDHFMTVTLFLCLLFAFFIIPPQPIEEGIFWITMSCLTYVPGIFLPWYTEHDKAVVLSTLTEQEKPIYAERYTKRTYLAWWLTVMFAIYTANYFVNIAEGYSDAVTIVIYQILSLLTKGAFAAITMDIHLDMLFDAERALLEEQRANESRRGFMKYIFHEVRTPLNSLTMGIDLLQSSPNLDDQDREYLLMMRSSSEFMSDTLDDVLNMQKIEEGKFELEYEKFSFRPTIARIFNTFRGAAIQKNIALSSFISPDTPEFVKGDMHRIEHVIGNFLSNAIKFTSENKRVNISVKLLSRTENEQGVDVATIKITVEDEGIGISQENQALLFNNFVQIRPSELQKGKGSGLGLALCKQVVSLHGGTIGVESKEGHGTSFYFIIPFEVIPNKEVAGAKIVDPNLIGIEIKPVSEIASVPVNPPTFTQGERKASPASQSVKTTVGSAPGGLNVLVVDDAESNTKMIVMLLKRINVSSKSADNGKEALDLVCANPLKFDMVLMDNLMPVMTGAESAKAMRETGFSNIIVGLTGNVMDDDINEYIAAGANMVLSKPLKKATLDKIVDFIKVNGPAMKPGMKLADIGETLEWVTM